MTLKCNLFGHNYRKTNTSDGNYKQRYSHICQNKNCEVTTDYPKERYKDTFWKSQTWSDTKVGILIIFAVLFIIIGIPVIVTTISQSNSCNVYAKQGIEVMYNFWTGCMAHSDKFGWLPIEQYFNTFNVNIK